MRERGPKAIHYAGALRVPVRNGQTVSIAPGWAACVSGARAQKIKAEGRNTYVRDEVTCMRCLHFIAQADAAEPGNATTKNAAATGVRDA